jgi:hypothetical protein
MASGLWMLLLRCRRRTWRRQQTVAPAMERAAALLQVVVAVQFLQGIVLALLQMASARLLRMETAGACYEQSTEVRQTVVLWCGGGMRLGLIPNPVEPVSSYIIVMRRG